MTKLDVWLDDEREAPEGWHRCRFVFEVVALIKAKRVRKLSLDHDLGHARKTGYDLVRWMVDNCKWPDERPEVHSANPVGAYVMREMIRDWFAIPFTPENLERVRWRRQGSCTEERPCPACARANWELCYMSTP